MRIPDGLLRFEGIYYHIYEWDVIFSHDLRFCIIYAGVALKELQLQLIVVDLSLSSSTEALNLKLQAVCRSTHANWFARHFSCLPRKLFLVASS